MRPFRATPWVLALACALPAVTLADDFSDYRIPDHFGGGWNANVGGVTHSLSRNESGQAAHEQSLQGSLTGRWNRFRDSDRRQWELDLQGGVAGDRQRGTADNFFTIPGPPPGSASSHVLSESRNTSEFVQIFASTRAYPWELPIGWELSGTGRIQDSQSWSDRLEIDTFDSINDQRTEISGQDVAWRYSEFATLRAAVGVGRVRDATPVFQAILLEERLQRDGGLVRRLSPAARQRVADLYSIRSDFGATHDLPAKFFWRELERLLREDGAVSDSGFDAYALQHADETLIVARSGFRRSIGWFVGPTIAASHQHDHWRFDESTRFVHFTDGTPDASFFTHAADRPRFFIDRTLYGLTAEFHRPLGDRTQVSLSEDAAINPGPDPDDLDVMGRALLQRLIAERWFGQILLTHDRFTRSIRGGPDYSAWSARAGGEIDYFLEDFLIASLELSQAWASQQFSGADRRQNVGFDARLSLSFGRGRLDAPGLITPQRPIH